MQQSLSDMTILYSGSDDIEVMKRLPAKKIFDKDVCDFLNSLSVAIRKDNEAGNYPDIVTFGFFCRKANVEHMKQQYMEHDRIGRGFSFHIAPSNVPINFAYTLVAGLLSGNACVVRVSTKDFSQTAILCRLLQKVGREMQSDVEKYIAIVKYAHTKAITDELSAMADIRVIWGGDETVYRIRESRIPPRCIDIAFADRYSIAVIGAKAVAQLEDEKEWRKIAQGFFNDTYLFDQNACSSPKLIYWVGNSEQVGIAKRKFWKFIHEYVGKNYDIEAVLAVDKLNMSYRAAIEQESVRLEHDGDNLIKRIRLEKMPERPYEYSCPGGYFLEYESETLYDLMAVITEKYQTAVYYGLDVNTLTAWVMDHGIRGIDRIVPIGKSADFSIDWDGYDLIYEMSRKITWQ